MNKLLLTLLALTFPFTAHALELTGKVVKVTGGDTITVLGKDNKQHRIRFQHIDAPENKQAYGQKSKEHLTKLIANKSVKVQYTELDRYKRILGVVWLEKTNINLSALRGTTSSTVRIRTIITRKLSLGAFV